MRFSHPVADRIWLWIIGIAFVSGAPIWVLIWDERSPVLGVLQAWFGERDDNDHLPGTAIAVWRESPALCDASRARTLAVSPV